LFSKAAINKTEGKNVSVESSTNMGKAFSPRSKISDVLALNHHIQDELNHWHQGG